MIFKRLGSLKCRLISVFSFFAAFYACAGFAASESATSNWTWSNIPWRSGEFIFFSENSNFAERGRDFYFRLKDQNFPLGISATTGPSEFQIFFNPDHGYSVIASGEVYGYQASVPEEGQLFEKSILFRGAGFAADYPISIQLEDPWKVISFEKSDGSPMAFKVLEFDVNGGVLDAHRYLRILVTSQGQALPLAVSNVSFQFQAQAEVDAGMEKIAIQSVLKKQLQFQSFENGRGAYLKFLDSSGVEIFFSAEGAHLLKSKTLNSSNPFATLRAISNGKIQKDTIVQMYPGTQSVRSAEPLVFSKNWSVLPREELPKDARINPEFLFLKTIDRIKRDFEQTTNQQWIDYFHGLRVAALYESTDLFPPSFSFIWNDENANKMFSALPEKAPVFFVDLAMVPQNSAGQVMDELDTIMRLKVDGIYFVGVSKGIARVFYLLPGMQWEIDELMEILFPYSGTTHCNLILSRSVQNNRNAN